MHNVYLIRTPDYNHENYTEVHVLLNEVKGPLKFIAANQNASEGKDLSILKKRNPLSWENLFSICNSYRRKHKVHKNDYVILLTTRENENNFFSFFEKGNNGFIHTSDWNSFTDSDAAQYPIAYEVVAIVLRLLMKLHAPIPNRWVHKTSLGCMNDLCVRKNEIILKLRTGDICKACLEKIKEECIEDEIIIQALDIFEAIRVQLLFKQGFARNIQPKEINIDNQGRIYIGEIEIEFDYLSKTLFIFFLKHGKAFSLVDLRESQNELIRLYKILRPAGLEESITNLVTHDYRCSTFSVNKNRLNKELKLKLGEPLAKFYSLVSERGNNRVVNFKMNTPRRLIEVDCMHPRLKKFLQPGK